MEKIKNMINPGKSKDDDVMYGNGQSGDHVHTGTGSEATSSPNTTDPLSSSTAPTTSSAREPIGQGGTGSIQQGSAPLSSSRTPGTFVDDGGSAMSIKSGLQGNSQESKITGIPDTHDPLDTNKALPREPTTGYTGAPDSSTTSGVGPHSSSMANKADPRVDSDFDGSKGLGGRDTAGMSAGAPGSTLPDRATGNTNDTGRSFPLGGASSGTSTSGPHDSNLANKADPRVDSDRDGSHGVGGTSGFGSGTGAIPGSAHQGDLSQSGLGGSSGGNTGVATGAATGVPLPKGYGEESWSHDHLKHGHEYGGDPCENEPPAPGAVHFVPGPHSLETTNRLDPHVGGGASGGLEHATVDSSSYAGDRQTGSGALASGAGMGTSGVGAYESKRDTPSASTTQPSTSAAGVGSYDSSRGTPSTSDTQKSKTTAGPHKSDLLNKADPRVDSDLSKRQGSSTTSGLGTSGTTSTTATSADRDHQHSRDAAMMGAGAGLGGAAAYGTEKHAGHKVPEGTSASGYSNPYPPSSSAPGPNLGPASSNDGGLPSSTSGPTSTTGPTPSSGLPSSSTEPTSSGLTSTTGPTSSTGPSPSSNMGSSVREPTGATGLTSGHAEPKRMTDQSATSRDHHYGRDAGLAGAGAGVGAGAAYEANKHLDRPRDDATTSRSLDSPTAQQPMSGSTRPDYGRDAGVSSAGATDHHDSRHQPTAASGLSGQPTSPYDETSRTGESHTGRNAALGAGAGAAAVAGGEELSKKDLERQQKAAHKEELKEQKAAHKQEVKEEKHHQHELDKAEKKHEKAVAAEHAKEEKHHQHELDKAKKEHDKAVAKEEAKHRKEESQEGEKEKKHHGLFGFLHRDKHDKEAKEDEATRTDGLEQARSGETGVAGADPGVAETEKHHDRNRLHKDPPPGYGATATDPSTSGRDGLIDSNRSRDNEGRGIEPTTGLPIDVSKGDGAGGTDATPVHGYHPEGSSTSGTAGTTGGSSTEGGFGHLQDHSR
ncbi:MAG: hypothetical protein Q9205_001145 [Flavoplaca limonia]